MVSYDILWFNNLHCLYIQRWKCQAFSCDLLYYLWFTGFHVLLKQAGIRFFGSDECWFYRVPWYTVSYTTSLTTGSKVFRINSCADFHHQSCISAIVTNVPCLFFATYWEVFDLNYICQRLKDVTHDSRQQALSQYMLL